MTRYAWGPTWKLDKAFKPNSTSAAEAAAELERIRGGRDTLPPADVVEESKPKDATLNAAFTWNNKEAADRWRIEQAREIIGGIRIISFQDDPAGNRPPVPVYCSYAKEPGERRGYRVLAEHIASDRDQILDQAIRDLQSLRARYDALEALQPVFTAIDEVTRPKPARARRKAG